MEPLLELVDRMTATVWVFIKYLPPNSSGQPRAAGSSNTSIRPRFLDAYERLLTAARHDYAKFQELLDIYKPHNPDADYSRDPLAWVVTGVPQSFSVRVDGEVVALRARMKRSASAFRDFANRSSGRKPPEASTKQDQDSEQGDATASHHELAVPIVLGALITRVETMERIWNTALNRSPNTSDRSLIEHCTTTTSDELFDRLAKWISSGTLLPQEYKELALEFVPPSLDSTPDCESRFLIESTLNMRARELCPRNSRFFSTTRSSSHVTAALAFDQVESPYDMATVWLALQQDERLDFLLDRGRLRSVCRLMDVPVPFSLVFSDELEEITRARELRLSSDPLKEPDIKERQGGDGIRGQSRGYQDNTTGTVHGNEPFPDQIAFGSCLFGLALSGGGIRSATFALGVIQAMADRNILPYIDIISSVSGGGYFSSFLISWIKRRGGVHSVQESLRGYATSDEVPAGQLQFASIPKNALPRNQNPMADHVRPIRLLREYARYLAPEEGLFSADVWAMAATWLRNTLLNFTVLFFLFAGVLLLPRFFVTGMYLLRVVWEELGSIPSVLSLWSSLGSPNIIGLKLSVLGGLAFLPICVIIGAGSLRDFRMYAQPSPGLTRGWGDPKVVRCIVLPLLLAGAFYISILWDSRALDSPYQVAVGFGVISLFGSFLMMVSSLKFFTLIDNTDIRPRMTTVAKLFACSIVTSFVGFVLVYGVCKVVSDAGTNSMRGIWIICSIGPPLMMVTTATSIVFMLGIADTLLSDAQREWWSRLGGWLGIVTFAWLTISSISFFSPLWIAKAGVEISVLVGGLTWTAITATGLKLAFSPRSASVQDDKAQPKWKAWMLKAAPVVFLLGFLCATSFVVFRGYLWLVNFAPSTLIPFEHPESNALCCTGKQIGFYRIVADYWPLLTPRSGILLLLSALLLSISFILASRINVNTFSMHHFYRNRLVRAYLGATRQRAHREPNDFTGFDPQDDIRLHRFRVADKSDVQDRVADCQSSYRGPFPIINTALNVTKGQDLGMQQRRAESFIFTPLWSGFDYMRKQTLVPESASLEFGFRQTQLFGNQSDSHVCQGTYLGTAMAISGAAFSSNAGFHTSPPLAFLLTVFGVRLGWWAGNPRKRTWSKDSPSDSLKYLACELTANTTVDREFVLLTDGGHFENMGLYELIRRKCRFIIVCDAEQDEKFKLEGIGGAVRKCRCDFGVVIDLNLDVLRPWGDPAKSALHFSVGSVRYPGEDKCGILIYIKASLTGDESVDLVEFGQEHPEFPHTPTINQMFDEAHFESYRELGHHVGAAVFQRNWRPTDEIKSGHEMCEVVRSAFDGIVDDWQIAKRVAESLRAGAVAT